MEKMSARKIRNEIGLSVQLITENTMMDNSMLQQLNQKLTAFTLETEWARDNLTITYRARRLADDQQVLLSVVQPPLADDAYFVRRLKDAVARNVNLVHPNILKTYGSAVENGLVYVVNEFVEAETLASYLSAKDVLPAPEVTSFINQIAAALDYAHSKAIRHGNLSDTTIFVRDGHIWLINFGLRPAIEGIGEGVENNIDNPLYLSPERVRGESPSRTADLYAMGILCYQMLVGEPPFAGTASAVLDAQSRTQPTPPHQVRSHIKPAVSEVVLRMLSKGLELRHSTGAEFARALQVAAEGSAPLKPITLPMSAVKDTRPLASPSLGQRYIFWIVLASVVVGAALVGGFWVANFLSGPSRGVISGTVTASGTQIATPPPLVTPQAVSTSVPPTVPPTTPGTSALLGITATATVPPESTTTPLPSLGTPVISEGSPFSNLILAHNITADYKPDQPATEFSATQPQVYLFFHYQAIQSGTPWRVVWKRGDEVVEEGSDTWPEEYGSAGTAWVYYAPVDGFQPGSYSVVLRLDAKTVATATFTVN